MLACRRRTERLLTTLWLAAIGGLALTGTTAHAIEVVSVSPAQLSLAPATTAVTVQFDRPLLITSVTPLSFRVFGRWSGVASGSFTFLDGNQTVTLTPSRPFSAGEPVFVNLAESIMGADASALRSAGYAYQFDIQTRAVPLVYSQIGVLQVRSNPGSPTRTYGILASDLNGDGYLDITTVNEISADLRVFLSLGNGMGTFAPFLPPEPIGAEASPNESADFNGDGLVDVAVAAASDDAVWISLGSGDGTFFSSQRVAVGTSPHGIAVLDVDGDGDRDIVNTNHLDNNLSLLLNNGSGVFGSPAFFEGGVNGEWALGAADFNNDEIFDVVVGAIDGEQVAVLLGTGNATFTPATPRSCGGNVWQLAVGDVDRDGNMDVSTGNSLSNNGAIVRGRGDGTFDPPQVVAAPNFVLATDLADLDGDQDLDWVLSSFGGGRWTVYTNDGTGQFTFNQDFVAPQAGSCSVPMDFDNDGDLDLAVIDELEDVVVLLRNTATPEPTEVCDGIDNDGDMLIDEDYPDLGNPCSVGAGACAASGVRVCAPNGLSTQCNATPGTPTTEVCDGIDNNCNGQTDEGVCALCVPAQTTSATGQTKKSTIVLKERPGTDKVKTKGGFTLPAAGAIAPESEEIVLRVTDGTGATHYEVTIPTGAFSSTASGRGFKFKDTALTNNGLKIATLVIDGDEVTVTYLFKAQGLDQGAFAAGTGTVTVKIGDQCFVDTGDGCVANGSGKVIKCQ